MEAVLLIGIQASGKSTFYRQHLVDTHVRVNLDMLRTLHRERRLIETCLEAGIPFVVDKTNATIEGRAAYIAAARQHGFRVVGYYFRSVPAEAIARNAARKGRARVPEKAILGTLGRLQKPSCAEGYDALFYVTVDGQGGFEVRDWWDEAELPSAPVADRAAPPAPAGGAEADDVARP